MMQVIENKHLLKGGKSIPLDTNEQVWKSDACELPNDGVSLGTLLPKLGRMVYKHNFLSPLLDYGKEINSPNLQEYYAVLKCGTELVQSENKYLKQSFYCGSRLCPNCSNIRSKKISNLIVGSIDVTKNWCSLTLTKSNTGLCYNLNKLQERLDYEQEWFNKVRDKYRKRGGDVSALISLETVAPGWKRKGVLQYYADYHPHYHIFCTYEFAVFLREEWLKEFEYYINEKGNKEILASPKNQHIRTINETIKLMQKKSPNATYNDALIKTIKEVIKYSLKPCLPKSYNSKNEYSINVSDTDLLVSLMKGKKRFKRWGCFLKKEKQIDIIENTEIKNLDLQKVAYNDLPVKDTGELINMENYKGEIVCTIPSYIKQVIWRYDYKRQSYYYTDEWGKEYELIKKIIRKYKINVFEGREKVKSYCSLK
jgi:hypothetical protein